MTDGQQGGVPAPWHPTYDVDKVIRDALEEDTAGIGDLSSLSTVPADRTATGTFLAKADGILAGQAVADRVFALVDPSVRVTWRKRDGDALTKGEAFAEAQGPARSLLLAERVALNFMQRMSGVATATARMVAEVDRGARLAAAAEGVATGAHRCRVLETRKTAPGLRLFDKWAVLIGGGSNHRMGLFDMVMVKDNHIAAAGGIAKAVTAVAEFLRGEAGKAAAQRLAEAKGAGGQAAQIPVEVEVRTLDEVDELLAVLRAAGGGGGGDGSGIGSGSGGEVVTRVMLDNMVRRLSPEEVEEAGGDAGGEGAEAETAATTGTAPPLPPPLRELERTARVDCSLLRAAVLRLSREFPHLETEASGNVTEQTAAAVASTGVAFVSVGALTHSVAALDVSFNIET